MRRIAFFVGLAIVGCESHPEVEFPSPTPLPESPAAPLLVSVDPMPSGAIVSWLANEEGDEVTSYSILVASEPWTSWDAGLAGALVVTTAGCCSMAVNGLQDETTYFVGMRATNEFGNSPDAPPRSVRPPGWLGSTSISTPDFDQAQSVAVDSLGNTYLAGWTTGDLPDETNLGGGDALVAKFSASGQLEWVHLYGSSQFDIANGVAVTSAGNVVVVGSASASFEGQTPLGGSSDMFAMMLEPVAGTPIWIKQYGTTTADALTAIATSDGAIFVAGNASDDIGGQNGLGGSDAVVMRLQESDGTPAWTRLLGTSAEDSARALTLSGDGGLITCGQTSGTLEGSPGGGTDGFCARFSTSGATGWVDQFGTTAAESCEHVQVFGSSAFVSGTTAGGLEGQTPLGMNDAFIRRMAVVNGSQTGIQLVGAGNFDSGVAILPSATGPYLIAASIGGVSSTDVVVTKFDATLTAEWTRVVGSAEADVPYAGSWTPAGAMVIVGETSGDLSGEPAAAQDAFLIKLDANGLIQ